MASTIKTRMNLREWSLLVLLSVLWGGSFFFVEVALVELPPLTLVALRVGFAGLALWGVVLAMGLRPPAAPGVWIALLGMGALNNVVPFSLIVWGQTHIASGLAAILNATTPLFTVLVAGLLLPDERISPLKLVGVIVGFAGVVVMFGLSSLDGASAGLAQAAVLGAAFSYACAGVFGRRFKRMGIRPTVTAAGQVTASTLILVPLAFLVDGPLAPATPGMATWAAVLGLALLSTAVAYVLYFKLLEAAGATNLLLVTLLIPVSAILLGSIVLGESLEVAHWVGMALIALGMSAMDGRLWRRASGVGRWIPDRTP